MNRKDIKKIAFYPGLPAMLHNEMFDTRSKYAEKLGGLPVVEGFVALKIFLADRGIEINTFDTYKNFKEIDLWIMMDPGVRSYMFLLKNFILPNKVLFYMYEQEIVNPWGWKYFKYYSHFHKVILSWSSDLLKKYPKKIVKYKIPVPFYKEKYVYYIKQVKKNLCLLLQSNKSSPVKGELYSLRRWIIRYFEERGDKLLDLYGFGWNSEIPATNIHKIQITTPFYTDLYKGTSQDKWQTFSEYHFVFCIQNSIPTGLFEYDPFMAMATGSVPIYLPPKNVDDYIPKEAYINYNDFEDIDDLVVYLKSIVGTDRYEEYRKAGWQFINSEKYKPFTSEQFCRDFYRAIEVYTKT